MSEQGLSPPEGGVEAGWAHEEEANDDGEYDLTAESTLPPITGRSSFRPGQKEPSAEESDPLKELVGGGTKWKYVQSCTELHLANRGFKKLANFEPLVNLECLWINGNRLSYITGLDRNVRIKELYAHDNQIGTLQGSLTKMTFLEILDLSNNKLRNLEKILNTLQELKFVRNLNLKGNPCCEEPDYRFFVIHRMPWVKVLDQHVVQQTERARAAKLLDPTSQARSLVAFGSKAPEFYGPWNDPVPEISKLEQELHRRAEGLRAKAERVGQKEDEQVFVRLGVQRPDLPPAGLSKSKEYPPAPPGWDEATTVSYEDRFRSPTGAAPLVRPDADGEQEGSGEERQAGTRSESGEERRVGGGAGGKSARDMTHKEILAIMESRDRPAGERRGAKGARDRRAYVAKDTYRVVKSQRKPVEGLEAEQESKSVRFTSTGLTFDREGFKKYAKRKQYSQPATLSAKDIRI